MGWWQANDVKSHGKSQRESCPAAGDAAAVASSLESLPHCHCHRVCRAKKKKTGHPPDGPPITQPPNHPSPPRPRPWLIINGGHCCMGSDAVSATCWKCKQRTATLAASFQSRPTAPTLEATLHKVAWSGRVGG